MKQLTTLCNQMLFAVLVLSALLLACSATAQATGKVPDGVLAYTLKVAGHGIVSKKGYHSSANIDWVVKGRIHMKGFAAQSMSQPQKTSKQASTAASSLNGMQKVVAACDGDQSCIMAAAYKYTASHRSQVAKARHAAPAKVQFVSSPRWSYMYGDCHATGVVKDSETKSGTDSGEGYSRHYNHHGERAGKQSLDCKSNASRAKIVGDAASRTYEIHIPWMDLPVTVSGDKIQTRHDTIRYQKDFVVSKVPLQSIRKTQHGQKTFHRSLDTMPVYGQPANIPLTMTLTWTFTPDKD